MNSMLEKLLCLRDDKLYLAVYGMNREDLSNYLIKHCCDSHKTPKSSLCLTHADKLVEELESDEEYTDRSETIENLLELIHRLIDECHLETEVWISQTNDIALQRIANLRPEK